MLTLRRLDDFAEILRVLGSQKGDIRAVAVYHYGEAENKPQSAGVC